VSVKFLYKVFRKKLAASSYYIQFAEGGALPPALFTARHQVVCVVF
jgi:hypothetical protein